MICPTTQHKCPHAKPNCIVEVKNNKAIADHNVCDECPSLYQLAPLNLDLIEDDEVKTIDDLLAILKPTIKRCSSCGMSAADIDAAQRLGCPTCYTTFGAAIKDIIIKAQDGAFQHTGKCPRAKRLKHLQDKMSIHVQKEEYEHANEIKKQIEALKKAQAGL